MRVYVVQYKLVSDSMPCVPDTFPTEYQARERAQTLACVPQVYKDIQVCSIRIPRYIDCMESVTIELEYRM